MRNSPAGLQCSYMICMWSGITLSDTRQWRLYSPILSGDDKKTLDVLTFFWNWLGLGFISVDHDPCSAPLPRPPEDPSSSIGFIRQWSATVVWSERVICFLFCHFVLYEKLLTASRTFPWNNRYALPSFTFIAGFHFWRNFISAVNLSPVKSYINEINKIRQCTDQMFFGGRSLIYNRAW